MPRIEWSPELRWRVTFARCLAAGCVAGALARQANTCFPRTTLPAPRRRTSSRLSAMERDVRLERPRIVVRELRDREEVEALPEAVVVNCTGLGAKNLLGDEETTPVEGQLALQLPQAEVDQTAISGRVMR
jgi:hypothetical protein